MHVFRLMEGGTVDKIIAFDSLPADLLVGIERGGTDGMPRHWKQFLGVEADGKDKDGKETFKQIKFYVLDYKWTNKDKEAWGKITSHVRRVCDAKIRLMDKIEDMARPMASDSKQPLDLQPEELEEHGALIPLPKETVANDVIPVGKKKDVQPTIRKVNREAHTCQNKGRRGIYADGCSRCDALKAVKVTA